MAPLAAAAAALAAVLVVAPAAALRGLGHLCGPLGGSHSGLGSPLGSGGCPIRRPDSPPCRPFRRLDGVPRFAAQSLGGFFLFSRRVANTVAALPDGPCPRLLCPQGGFRRRLLTLMPVGITAIGYRGRNVPAAHHPGTGPLITAPDLRLTDSRCTSLLPDKFLTALRHRLGRVCRYLAMSNIGFLGFHDGLDRNGAATCVPPLCRMSACALFVCGGYAPSVYRMAAYIPSASGTACVLPACGGGRSAVLGTGGEGIPGLDRARINAPFRNVWNIPDPLCLGCRGYRDCGGPACLW